MSGAAVMVNPTKLDDAGYRSCCGTGRRAPLRSSTATTPGWPRASVNSFRKRLVQE
jgi:hypothetical protein